VKALTKYYSAIDALAPLGIARRGTWTATKALGVHNPSFLLESEELAFLDISYPLDQSLVQQALLGQNNPVALTNSRVRGKRPVPWPFFND